MRGEGVYVWDAEGKRYLDFAGSAAVNFIGHGVTEVSASMAEQAAQLEFVHSSQFTTPVAEEYAQELLEFAGENFRGGSVYFTCGGSESVETALKLARQYQVEIGETRRYRILSREQSYHGSTLGALAVSGNKRRREIYLPMVLEFAHLGFPYCYRCSYDCTDGCQNCGQQYAEELERAIKASNGEAAAFILEPVSGATLGAVVPPDGYLKNVAEICGRHGVLLIADEVMTGMGRTGRNFAVEHWDVAPDILVSAKGLSSGYAPLGAVIASQKGREGGATAHRNETAGASSGFAASRKRGRELTADTGRIARPSHHRGCPWDRPALGCRVCRRQGKQAALSTRAEFRCSRGPVSPRARAPGLPDAGLLRWYCGRSPADCSTCGDYGTTDRLGSRAVAEYNRGSCFVCRFPGIKS